MNIRYKEEPSAWSKSTLLSVIGLIVVSSLLRWRHVLGTGAWCAALVVLASVSILAWLRPKWFRGYYRFSTWAGFWSSQCVARLLLVFVFVFLITPAAFFMRLLGKDSLQLKRSQALSYWKPTKQSGSLDRLF